MGRLLRQYWANRRLATRIVSTSLALLLLVQLAGLGVVRLSIANNARTQIAQELEIGEQVWHRGLAQNAERLRQGAALLAADYGFRSAVHSEDVDTISSALENHGQRIGAGITAQFDPSLHLKAISQTGDAVLEPVLHDVAERLERNLQASQLALVGNIPYQFVMVPMRAPLLIGWVLMGFPLSQAQADDLHALLSVHLAVLTHKEGQTAVVVSTLPSEPLQRALSTATDDGELVVDHEVLVTRRVTLLSGATEVEALLLRSIDEVMAPYRRLQLILAAITALGVLLFAAGSALTARHVTRPLQRLLAFSERLRAGDYSTPLHLERATSDEVGRLSSSFEHMRESIEHQQGEIRTLAYWDRLTGLPNREQFREALKSAMATGTQGTDVLSVLTLNLDRFKHVNDVLGYAFGDELLCAVAKRLREQVCTEGDMVARLGGDEFAILLTHSSESSALSVSARILQAFTEPLALGGQTVDISASIGVACWPEQGNDADLLLSRSEVAMHAAKSKTLGTLVYTPALDSSSAQNLSMLTELRQALEQNELRLFLQPKIDVASGRVVAAEALVRWQHPQRGLVPPMQFIPFAEQTGFIRQLTLWMFEEAARHWHRLQSELQPLRVAINLSTRDLLDMEFPARLAGMLEQYGVAAEGFCLEITESAIMDDPQRAEATLNRLSAQGFKLSIDDFGTGYSSLAYLKRLPVSELKIDQSFVKAMESDQNDAKIVRSTIDLAHNLGLSVVAEGVETQAILDALYRLNCDEAQGYFMSRPLPIAEFLLWRSAYLGSSH